MRKLILLIFLATILASACVTIAPPPPMITFGGPEITEKGSSELAMALGTAAVLFDGAHAGANGYFLRYKHGISNKFDLGVDWTAANRTDDGLFISAKIATRYQLAKNHRLELGLGAADDSDGKSLHGDLAYTLGTTKDRVWNYYTSLRLGYAHGYAGNAIFADQTPLPEDTIVPPNTIFAMVNLGAQAQINTNQKFIFEGAYGRIFPKGHESGHAFFISAGILFNINKQKE